MYGCVISMLMAWRRQAAVRQLNAVNATSCLQLPQPSSEGLGSQYVQHGGQRATLGGAREHSKPRGQVAMVQHPSPGISQHQLNPALRRRRKAHTLQALHQPGPIHSIISLLKV
jgi:hypothetical protein